MRATRSLIVSLANKRCQPWIHSSVSASVGSGLKKLLDVRYHSSGSSTPQKLSSTTLQHPNHDNTDHRIPQIRMHPLGLSQRILPGGLVMDKRGKKQYVEMHLGYFWMMKDLSATGNKPILSNETLIPEREAEVFPTLYDLTNLHQQSAVLPDCVLQNNDCCSLVAIAFKQFGNRQAATWIEPFEKAFADRSDVNAYPVIITEGLLFKMLLKSLVVRGTREQTPPDKHDKRFLYFGNIPDIFQDSLRMHNTMAGYVFLLDGKGRVRFAGSGEASEEEVERLLAFANTLTRPSVSSSKHASSSSKQSGAMGMRR